MCGRKKKRAPTSCENTHGQRGGRGSHGVLAHARACCPNRASKPALDDIMCAATLRQRWIYDPPQPQGDRPDRPLQGLLSRSRPFFNEKAPLPPSKPPSRVDLIFRGRTLQQIFQSALLSLGLRFQLRLSGYSIFFRFCAANALSKVHA